MLRHGIGTPRENGTGECTAYDWDQQGQDIVSGLLKPRCQTSYIILELLPRPESSTYNVIDDLIDIFDLLRPRCATRT